MATTKIIDFNLEYPEMAPTCPQFGSCSSAKFKVKYFFIVQNAPSTVTVEVRLIGGGAGEKWKYFNNKFGTFDISGEFEAYRPYEDYGFGTIFEFEIQVYPSNGQTCKQNIGTCKAVYTNDFVVQNIEEDDDTEVDFGQDFLEAYNFDVPMSGMIGEQIIVKGDIKLKDLNNSVYAQKIVARILDKEYDVIAEKVVDNAIYSTNINLPKYYQDVSFPIILTENCSSLAFQIELFEYVNGHWSSSDVAIASENMQIESIPLGGDFPIIPVIPDGGLIIPEGLFPGDTTIIEQKKEIPWALIVLGAGGLLLLFSLMTKKKENGQSQSTQPTV